MPPLRFARSQIQYQNRYPDQLAVPSLRPDMDERIITPNGNKLRVRTTLQGVTIKDERVIARDGIAMYHFVATVTDAGLLQASVRSRAPNDWPHRRHPDIRPKEQLRQSIDYFDSGPKPVNTFRALWEVNNPLSNTNALLFKRYVEDPAHQEMDPIDREQAAILQTPTGKIMTALGFNLDMGTFFEDLNNGTIEVDFTKPQTP